MTHDILHVMSARCVARDLHTVAPGHLNVCVGDRSRHSEEIVKNLEWRLSMRSLLINAVFVVNKKRNKYKERRVC